MPKKELLSVVYHLEYYRHYLLGRPFKLYVDNQTIATMLATENHTLRDRTVAGWKVVLNEYDFSVMFLPGNENTLADYTSRVQRVFTATDPGQTEQEIATILGVFM